MALTVILGLLFASQTSFLASISDTFDIQPCHLNFFHNTKNAYLLFDYLLPYYGQKQLSHRGLLQHFSSLPCWIDLSVTNNQKKWNQVTYVHNITDCWLHNVGLTCLTLHSKSYWSADKMCATGCNYRGMNHYGQTKKYNLDIGSLILIKSYCKTYAKLFEQLKIVYEHQIPWFQVLDEGNWEMPSFFRGYE